MKTLGELFRNVPEAAILSGDWGTPVTGIVYDSRRVKPGFLFVCIKGIQTDGHLYIQDAVNRGAAGIVVQEEVRLPSGVSCVKVNNTRSTLADLSAEFYENPSCSLRMIGITGTNGKTTTTYLIEAIFKEDGKKIGLIGTIENRLEEKTFKTAHTTPESADLQKLLATMCNDGARFVVMEVSSHALALDRVRKCEYDIAVFTNLTQDHLDFHQNFEDYLRSKTKLFLELETGSKKGPKYAVINIDDPHSREIVNSTRVPVITYGLEEKAHVRASNVRVKNNGISFNVFSPKGNFKLELKLAGLFNVYNSLAACTVALQEGIKPAVIKKALEDVQGIPGRFQLIDEGQDFTVVVDYAHTPDGLENVLKAAREMVSGNIITVFGCGGDRDKGKRPLMGEVAARYSDLVIITSDNPRSEDPNEIIAEIEPSVKNAGADYHVQPDRYRAIQAAIALARSGDLVLIAGKGHETYQIIGKNTVPFDDRAVARRILQMSGGERNNGC